MVPEHGDPGRERFLVLVRESLPPQLELISDQDLPRHSPIIPLKGYTVNRLGREQPGAVSRRRAGYVSRGPPIASATGGSASPARWRWE